MLKAARRSAGLSQDELARRARTSRPTLSAYEHGRKSPTMETAARLLAEAGYELDATPHVDFTTYETRRRTRYVPAQLPRLPLAKAIAVVVLPLHLNWSSPGRRFHLADRDERARVYETVLREGDPADMLAYIDGALLVDGWNDLVLPRDVRAAWAPVVAEALAAA